MPRDAMFSLYCQHYYCRNCFASHIESRIPKTGKEFLVNCPDENCRYIVPLDVVQFLCSEDIQARARQNMLKAFIEDNDSDGRARASYCKNPHGCEGIVLLADDNDGATVTCALCTQSFCGVCDLPPHAPATCAMVSGWENKGGFLEIGTDDQIANRKLLHSITKPCPRCGLRIEKNDVIQHL